MADEQIIRQLIQEMMDSNQRPEEVCRNHPELLEELRARWQEIRVVERQLDMLFPSSGPTPQLAGPIAIDSNLPQIPGYDVQSLLGHGGMGVVYKARHLTLNRPIALKMVLAGAYASEVERQRLLREAQAVAALCHPNIVMVHDVGQFDGRPYFTMEFVGGGNLAMRLAGTPQSARDAAALVATLADAMHSAHQAGIVHRDLKPANVLLTPDGIPKITDFGLARYFAGDPGLTLSGVRVGTPSYMAPEQASGDANATGPSVDIYSLGALLYEMLTGRPPFRADTAVETQRQVIEDEPAAPSRLNSRIPRDLETICLKCLQKSPVARYATARELNQDIQRYLHGEPIAARRTGAAVRVVKWARRHPAHAVAWTGAAIAIAAILGAVMWTVSQRSAIERAVADDLAEVIRLEEASEWRAARNMLERAKMRLEAAAGRDRLKKMAHEIEQELDLVDRLAALRFELAATARDLEMDKGYSWSRYREAFSQSGLLFESDSPVAFAARVARSHSITALVSALDDMANCATNATDLDWLLHTTRLVDPDPQWRDKARDMLVWIDHGALVVLARDAQVEKQPPTLLLNVAGRLLATGPKEAESLIRRVLAAHPSDFWANFALADALDARGSAEAIGYYRTAIALRPDATAAHVHLAMALAAQDNIDDAIESMNRAVSLDPESWVARYNLARWLFRQQRNEEGLKHIRIATQIDHPRQEMAYLVLGRGLLQSGQPCDGVTSLRRAEQLAPEDVQVRHWLARAVNECKAASSGITAP